MNKLDKRDEFDELKDEREKEWAAAQTAEYQAAGITMDGKNYYYQGQLVNIFLDIRANQSFFGVSLAVRGLSLKSATVGRYTHEWQRFLWISPPQKGREYPWKFFRF